MATAALLDLNTGLLRVAALEVSAATSTSRRNWKNFGPRLGIAYQLTPKTVLRMGYGRSYDIGVFGSIFGHAVTQNLPVLAVQNLNRQLADRRRFQPRCRPNGAGFPCGSVGRVAASA